MRKGEVNRRVTTTEPDLTAEGAADPQHLLPGEKRTSQLADDAEHWIRVYSEFIRFKHDLLVEVDNASGALADDARRPPCPSPMLRSSALSTNDC